MQIDPDLFVLSIPLLLFVAAAVRIWRRWPGDWRFAAVVPVLVIVLGIAALQPLWWRHAPWAGYESAFLVYPLVLVGGGLVTGLLVLTRGAMQSRGPTQG